MTKERVKLMVESWSFAKKTPTKVKTIQSNSFPTVKVIK
jgi:hypothetical protein